MPFHKFLVIYSATFCVNLDRFGVSFTFLGLIINLRLDIISENLIFGLFRFRFLFYGWFLEVIRYLLFLLINTKTIK